MGFPQSLLSQEKSGSGLVWVSMVVSLRPFVVVVAVVVVLSGFFSSLGKTSHPDSS